MPRPLTFPIKKLIGFDAKLWKQVQEYRFDARFNTESDAVRHLIEVGLKASLAAPSSGSSGGARKPRSTGKRTTPRKGPERKAAPSSKLDQIRALREQGTH